MLFGDSSSRHNRSLDDDMRWVTFDCFGTLVDWHAGFSAILAPLAGAQTPDLLRAYHRVEPLLEAETPHRLYKDVLASSVLQAARDVGIPLSATASQALPREWAALPVFEDVEPMLAGLRAMGVSLAVLTNCDDDLFALTQRAFGRSFDLVVTAERVRDYKPSATHFRFFSRSTGVRAADWVHVAASWFHDIEPAGRLGLKRVWLDREGEGSGMTTGDNGMSIRVRSGAEVGDAVSSLFAGGEQVGDVDTH